MRFFLVLLLLLILMINPISSNLAFARDNCGFGECASDDEKIGVVVVVVVGISYMFHVMNKDEASSSIPEESVDTTKTFNIHDVFHNRINPQGELIAFRW